MPPEPNKWCFLITIVSWLYSQWNALPWMSIGAQFHPEHQVEGIRSTAKDTVISGLHLHFSFYSVQKRLYDPVGDELFSTLKTCPHSKSHGKCSEELHSLFPPLQIFTGKTSPHSMHIPFLRKNVPLRQLLSKGMYFVEQTLERMFIQTLQSKPLQVHDQPLSILQSLLTVSSYVYITTLISKPLPWVALKNTTTSRKDKPKTHQK